MSEMGLDNKGAVKGSGSVPVAIDAGTPSGGSPGPGEVVGTFAGTHTVGGPADGAGVR